MQNMTQQLLSDALRHHEGGDLETAWTTYQEALKYAPENPIALSMMGVIQQQLGNLDNAEALLGRAAELDPADANTQFNLGLTLWELGRTDEARLAFEQCISLNPRRADALNMLGRIAMDLGDLGTAKTLLKKATRLAPKDGAGWINLTGTLHRLGENEEALTACRKAIRLLPDDPRGPFNMGTIQMDREKVAEAETAFRTAIDLAPDYVDALVNLAVCLIKQYRPEEAETFAARAMEISPDNALAAATLAIALTRLGKKIEALPLYERSLELDPEDGSVISNLACHYLVLGAFDKAWPLFEEMRVNGTREDKVFIDAPGVPEWTGENLAGKKLLVSGEQGVGEQIMFASTLPELLAQGADITYAVDSRMVPLFSRSLPDIRIVDADTWAAEPGGRFDFYASVGSLAMRLRRSTEDFDGQQPFLQADPALTRRLRERYRRGGDLLVGISWRSASQIIGLAKNVPLDLWDPILTLPDCRFVSVQYGDAQDECDAVRKRLGIEIVVDPEVDALKSIEQNAAQIAACDIIVSISNATLHIAGAMGVRTLAMIGRDPNWYWGEGQGSDRSLWYPSVELQRQSNDGQWRHVIDRAAEFVSGKGET